MTGLVGIALSGGADSALAAWQLLSRGVRVVGFHLMLSHSADAAAQLSSAQMVAERLGIELHTIDAADVFACSVVAPFCAEYAVGRTPNPCITCNREVKFGLLLREARARGAEALATGHYAQVGTRGDVPVLRCAEDEQSDQSYFLYAIAMEALPLLTFPLGEMMRGDVREMARLRGLALGRPSQDICFLEGRNYRSFIAGRVRLSPGDIVDLRGNVRGHHEGLPFYTIGQRHHLGIALGEPAYVVHLDAANNRVVVGTAADLKAESTSLTQVRWLVPPAGKSVSVQARIRYRSRLVPAQVALSEDGAYVRFAKPQRAVAPGQSIVFYEGDTVLGGGVVATTYPPHDE
jgi:tRNA-uridine 2-sulfurtransferase